MGDFFIIIILFYSTIPIQRDTRRSLKMKKIAHFSLLRALYLFLSVLATYYCAIIDLVVKPCVESYA